MTGIGDPTGPAIMHAFSRRHNVVVTGHTIWSWACSCGRHGRDTTEGRATAGRDRHLRTALLAFLAEVDGLVDGRREFGGMARPCDVCGRGTGMRETADGQSWAYRCDRDSVVLKAVLDSLASPGKMEP